MPIFKKSERKDKKYKVFYNGNWIHFGHRKMQQYRDSTGLGLYSHLDHLDKRRRDNYRARAKGIKNDKGEYTYKNPNYANYYSYWFLWS